MAISATAATCHSLGTTDRTVSLASSSSSSSSSSKLSSSTVSYSPSVQFPIRLRRTSFGGHGRILPVVQAKKETFASLDELLIQSDKPVLVDFYATWCGPCQFMAPVLDQVGAKLKDQIRVVKIDTEKYPSIADQYKIQALPTFILFKDGEPYDRFEGALPADQLIERIVTTLEAS